MASGDRIPSSRLNRQSRRADPAPFSTSVVPYPASSEAPRPERGDGTMTQSVRASEAAVDGAGFALTPQQVAYFETFGFL
jgi:hypothetical protein